MKTIWGVSPYEIMSLFDRRRGRGHQNFLVHFCRPNTQALASLTIRSSGLRPSLRSEIDKFTDFI